MPTSVSQGSFKHQAWGLMCSRQTFSCREIAQALNINSNKIAGFARTLLRGKAIELVDRRTQYKGALYRVCIARSELSIPLQINPKRKERRKKKGTRSQQIWNTIRINRSFNVELIETTTDASLTLIHSYLWQLEQCGVIRKQGRFLNSIGYSCWKYVLIKDLGRLYPTTQPQGMWDQNSGTFIPYKELSDE
ncbi:hypothetical protein LZP69_10485 [Shewanella sp. AS1]|uniref:hypothetical protein n=1 Tax=Shewanella sp. AS1 TaxID=2907626 RepID=UPI001F2A12CA|nr:hypothetical protein [Shewanella sp. AS1]MCE9679586.1 hypothetical protein [Shewanella sp. AS1]